VGPRPAEDKKYAQTDRCAEHPKCAPMGMFEVFRLSRKGVGGAQMRNATWCRVSHPWQVANGSFRLSRKGANMTQCCVSVLGEWQMGHEH